MWPAVSSNWLKINSKWEGYLTFLYLDALGYVTTGMGNLADPVSVALAMPWTIGGSPASQADILAQWNAVDGLRTAPKGQKQGGPAATGGQHFGGYTTMRLSTDAINAICTKQLAANESASRPLYPNWDSIPADAQFAIMSMEWAMGAGALKSFTQFNAAINSGDYTAAVPLSVFRGTGVAPRIVANQQMLRNAAAVVANGADPSVLYYPDTVPSGSSPPSGLTGTDVALLLGGVLATGLIALAATGQLHPVGERLRSALAFA